MREMRIGIGNLLSIELPYTARSTRNDSSTHPIHQLGDREVQLTVNIDLVSWNQQLQVAR